MRREIQSLPPCCHHGGIFRGLIHCGGTHPALLYLKSGDCGFSPLSQPMPLSQRLGVLFFDACRGPDTFWPFRPLKIANASANAFKERRHNFCDNALSH
jgi:hypothetical protein